MTQQPNLSSPPKTPIAHLSRARDALNVRLIELARKTSEADQAAPCSAAFLEAERRELAVDHELADVCATILTIPPSCAGDLALKARTVAFIADQDHIWDFDKFKDEIVIFAKQVADWSSCGKGEKERADA